MTPAERQRSLRSVRKFGQFILGNQDKIVRHWISVVARSPEVEATADLSYHQLVDHLPALCAELGSFLKNPRAEAVRAQAARDAGEHGRKRWHQGYRLAELIHELCLLRDDVMDVWIGIFAAQHDWFRQEARDLAEKLVQRYFDDLVIESTRQFVAEKTEAIRRFEADLASAQRSATDTKSSLLRHVTHALREPLAAITFAAEALNADRSLSATARDNVRIILRNASNQAHNIEELVLAAQLHRAGDRR